jgi:phosphoribosyl-ATP pyrophosphohydrolase
MEELQLLVIEWAREKGLLTNVTPKRIFDQTDKVLEELGETAGARLKQNREGLIDGIGDIAVTLIILNAMKGNVPIKTPKPLFPNEKGSLALVAKLFLAGHLTGAMFELSFFASNHDLKLQDCLQVAYDVISKRTGKMVGDTFIKDEQ